MANARIRFYPGETGGSTIMGFSARVTDLPDQPNFGDFLSKNGYTTREIAVDEAPEGGQSYRYVEVRPPLSDEHVEKLGSLCVRIGDAGNNYTYAIDNRYGLPDSADERVIAAA